MHCASMSSVHTFYVVRQSLLSTTFVSRAKTLCALQAPLHTTPRFIVFILRANTPCAQYYLAHQSLLSTTFVLCTNTLRALQSSLHTTPRFNVFTLRACSYTFERHEYAHTTYQCFTGTNNSN